MASDALDGDKSPELGPLGPNRRPLQLRMGTVRSSGEISGLKLPQTAGPYRRIAGFCPVSMLAW